MIINLNEIPDEGLSYSFSRETGELNESLQELLEDSNYKVDFYLRPLGQGFELKGKGTAELPEMCSRCGIDIRLGLNAEFNEILMPKLKLERNSKYSKPNHISDNDHLENKNVNVTEFIKDEFDVGDFVREAFTLLVPICPVAEVDDKGNCNVCGVDINNTKFGYEEDMGENIKKSPFDILKNFKPQ